MRGQRRPFVYIVLVTAIILVAVLAYRNFPGQSPTDKDAGFFTQAVNNYATCQKSASECASFDKSKIISPALGRLTPQKLAELASALRNYLGI